MDVVENDDSILLIADLPGVAKDNLRVRVENNTLQIEGELSIETPKKMELTYAEMRVTGYRRHFTLSRELDSSQMVALLKNGVLSLTIPKTEQAKPRRIEVKIG
ncbi:HSP20 family protein [Gammaproteobacteria bacterium]